MKYYTLSNIVGDPFWLTTMPMALVGWAVALVGSILSSANDASRFPVFSWWGIAFEMIAILMTLHVAFTNQVRMYRQAILVLLAIATVYTTNTTNNFVWRDNSSSGAAAAGNILLSIINFIWIFYFGTTADEPVHMYIDSFAVYKSSPSNQTEFRKKMGEKRRAMVVNNRRRSHDHESRRFQYRMSDISNGVKIGKPTQFVRQTNPDAPSGIANDETGSDPLSSTYLYSVEQLQRHGLNGHEVEAHEHALAGQRLSVGTIMPGNDDPYAPDNEFDEYDINNPIARAIARYSYEGCMSDAELPFKEGEILDICDMTGNWWYCKRQNGDVGICPKNYLKLLDEHMV